MIDDNLKREVFWEAVSMTAYGCQFEGRESMIRRLRNLANFVADFSDKHPQFFERPVREPVKSDPLAGRALIFPFDVDTAIATMAHYRDVLGPPPDDGPYDFAMSAMYVLMRDIAGLDQP